MLYHLFQYLQEVSDFSGAGLFQYISFRAGMAIITSLIISMVFGGRLIKLLQKILSNLYILFYFETYSSLLTFTLVVNNP
mgnify:CR=1 FL=1